MRVLGRGTEQQGLQPGLRLLGSLWLSCSKALPAPILGSPGPHILGPPPGPPTLGHQERGQRWEPPSRSGPSPYPGKNLTLCRVGLQAGQVQAQSTASRGMAPGPSWGSSCVLALAPWVPWTGFFSLGAELADLKGSSSLVILA